jgi:Phage capsid family
MPAFGIAWVDRDAPLPRFSFRGGGALSNIEDTELATSRAELEHRINPIGDFASYCRYLALNKGSASNARAMAQGRASPRVVELLTEKTAVGAAGAGTAGSWVEQTVAQRLVVGPFTDSLKSRSAWAAMQSQIFRVPLESVLGLVAISSTNAAAVPPGASTPMRLLALNQASVRRQKVGAVVALTAEFMRESAAEAESVITRELSYAVAREVDAQVYSVLTAGVTARTATTSLANDVAALLTAVSPQADSRLVFWAAPDMAVRLAVAQTSNQYAFPDVTVSGGTVLGVPLHVSGGMPAATLLLVDAARVAGALEAADVSITTQTSLEMADSSLTMSAGTGSPAAGVGANVVSLWQANAVGIMVLQYFGVAVTRGGAASTLYAGGSP